MASDQPLLPLGSEDDVDETMLTRTSDPLDAPLSPNAARFVVNPSMADVSAHSSLPTHALVSPTGSPPHSPSSGDSFCSNLDIDEYLHTDPSAALDTNSEVTCQELESEVDKCKDIGLLLQSMDQSAIRNLPPNKKFSILINHFKPDCNFKFPKRYIDGCNRSCKLQYLLDNPWFVYSKAEDGLFCLPCVLFANVLGLGQLVQEKFNHWTRKTTKFASHNSKRYHQLAMTRLDALKSSMTTPGSSIEDRMKQISTEEILKNRFIMKSLADAVLVCGRQNLSLRGHRDDRTFDACLGNKGNFLALVDFSVRSGNKTLGHHLETAARNAVYTSKTTQNDLIECIGDHIRDTLLTDVKKARWYSILCDEVVDSGNKQQVSIVLRFVLDSTIREEFVDFVSVERITGEVLANKLKEMLEKYGLELGNCRGQGYDGAANMSGESGVQGRLLRENPKAMYIHCNSHILNLCIVQACSLQTVRNMNCTVTEAANFFASSQKRQTFLEKVIDKKTKVVRVKDLCRTRWIYRHEAYENFHILLVDVMVAITEHDLTYGEMNWDSKTVVAANGLLKMFLSFSFILSFVVVMNAMSIVKPLSIKLQYKTSDIVYAFSKVTEVINELDVVRKDDKMVHSWYVAAETLAGEVGVLAQVPRVTSRQCHRDNVEHQTTEQYYCRTIIYPFLDNLKEQMRERFGSTQIIASKLISLVPSVISCNDVCYDDLITMYNDDLPNPSVVATEIMRWKAKWEGQAANDRPESLRATLQKCDSSSYPNIHTLLRLGSTLPVTSCENERVNSTLKNLKTYLRSTMSEERLSALALMHVHYDLSVDLDCVVDKFKLKCNRRIKL